MPLIQNVAAIDVKEGCHFDPGPNSVLISIVDPAGWRPTPKFPFQKVFNFEFFDFEDEDIENGFPLESFISKEQAEELVKILKEALDNDSNVIVHCQAGVCRSGAVVEVAVSMGFQDSGNFRLPNTRVQRMMTEALQSL